MNAREFVNAVRRKRLDDDAVQADGTPGTRLWSDDEIRDAGAEAQREACERADLLRDEFTPAVCLIPIIANQELYPLHWSVYAIDEVRYTDNGNLLVPTSDQEMDCGTAGGYYDAYGWRPNMGRGGRWQNGVGSRSGAYILKYSARERMMIRPFPIGNVATYVDRNGTTQPLTLKLAVYRYAIWPFKAPSDQFEIHARHHERLIDWVLGRMYEKNDSDAGDPAKSEKCYAAFDRSFGIRKDARTQTDLRERRCDRAAPHGI